MSEVMRCGTFMVASARDWAKLGQLYLNNGRWGDAQLFDPQWVNYVSTINTASKARRYGAGFMGRRPTKVYSDKQVPVPPKDLFAAHGLQNQSLYIVPSEQLVVVRLGATRDYWQSGEWSLLTDIVAAKR